MTPREHDRQPATLMTPSRATPVATPAAIPPLSPRARLLAAGVIVALVALDLLGAALALALRR